MRDRQTKLKVIYKPPEEVTPEMERSVARAYEVIFEAVMRNRQAKAIKMSEIKMNYENEYTKLSK
ncbi:MAG: hypothetical protein Q7S73_02325 [bacterium]|nr:hypothetical protein [bacterium]